MLIYGILIDCMYIDGKKLNNVQIYISPNYVDQLCFLHFKEKKIISEFAIKFSELSGFSDKSFN